MADSFDEVLAEFLRLSDLGTGDLDDFIVQHPEFATDLRDYLITALEIERIVESIPAGPQTVHFDSNAIEQRSAESDEEIPPSMQTRCLGEEDTYQSYPGSEIVDGDAIGLLQPALGADEIGRLGHYRALEVLGVGGMGIVFKAEDSRLDRMVALKVMKPSAATNKSAKERFLREAKAMAAVTHDNIVDVYDVGQVDDVPFIAMQFLRGESLQARLRREGRMDQREILRIGREVVLGLSAAHQHGISHRDIKPENIWLEEDSDRAKILDFGLVRHDTEDAGLTQTGMILGTPRYMAPEQALGHDVDHRSDLFSLGCVLYHLSSGKAPFDGGSVTATLIAVAHREPEPLRNVCPELHPKLAGRIMQMLAKDRDRRPQSAAEVAKALTKLENRISRMGAYLIDQDKPPTRGEALSTRPTSDSDDKFKRPRFPVPRVVSSVGILMMLATVCLLIWTWGNEAERPLAEALVAKSSSTEPSSMDNLKVRTGTDTGESAEGWPEDAPPSAVIPFDAYQAKQFQASWADYLGTSVEYTNTLGMRFRLIPPGGFVMGTTSQDYQQLRQVFAFDEEFVQHLTSQTQNVMPRRVRVAPFYLGITEVTREQFGSFIEATAYVTDAEKGEKGGERRVNRSNVQNKEWNWRTPGHATENQHPVGQVSWNDATAFCKWLTESTGNRYYLPTEEEWEFACRAGERSAWSPKFSERGWHGGQGLSHPQRVAAKPPNEFGLYDMHGNVWEWNGTRHREITESSRHVHVVRGGAYYSKPPFVRPGNRYEFPTDSRRDSFGFRVALSLESLRLKKGQ